MQALFFALNLLLFSFSRREVVNLNTSELWSCYPQLEGRDMFRPFCILAFNLFGRDLLAFSLFGRDLLAFNLFGRGEGICLGPSVFSLLASSGGIFSLLTSLGGKGYVLGPSVFLTYHRSHLIFNVFDNAQGVSEIRGAS